MGLEIQVPARMSIVAGVRRHDHRIAVIVDVAEHHADRSTRAPTGRRQQQRAKASEPRTETAA